MHLLRTRARRAEAWPLTRQVSLYACKEPAEVESCLCKSIAVKSQDRYKRIIIGQKSIWAAFRASCQQSMETWRQRITKVRKDLWDHPVQSPTHHHRAHWTFLSQEGGLPEQWNISYLFEECFCTLESSAGRSVCWFPMLKKLGMLVVTFVLLLALMAFAFAKMKWF